MILEVYDFDRETGRQGDRETGRQGDRETGRQVYIFSLIMMIIACLFIVYKFSRHEIDQNKTLNDLSLHVKLLDEKLNSSDIKWKDDTYNYLAIGNSITVHMINDYWWNECGMAASTSENDYVHQLSSMLKNEVSPNVSTYAYNFSSWETTNLDRSECLSLLDGYLSSKLDLVTIQLGENVNDLTTFSADFNELISYVQDVASDAEIIVIGDFWYVEQRDKMKEKICDERNIIFVSLNGINDDLDYQCGLGYVVYDKIGREHIVEHEGVSRHPNDKAMYWISQHILQNIENKVEH